MVVLTETDVLMEKATLTNKEKIIIILRDSTWIFFLYIILRVAVTSLFQNNVDLNIPLTLLEKISAVIIWLVFIFLSYFTSKVHKELKNKYGKLLLLSFLKEAVIVSITVIILVELYILNR